MLRSELGLLEALTEFSVNQNEISGGIPKEMGWLAATNGSLLEVFNIGNNSLMTGTVPESMCSIPMIAFDCYDDGGLLCGCLCACPATP